jgi:hypothetical protein
MADNKLNVYDQEARPSETAHEQKLVQDSPMVSKQSLLLRRYHTQTDLLGPELDMAS